MEVIHGRATIGPPKPLGRRGAKMADTIGGHRPEKDPEFLRNGLRLISRVPLEAGRGRPVHRYRNAVEIV